jgi:AP-4 complex subunit epsilon-1
MKEYLIRAIYLEMLGHDASFARIHAVNAASNTDILVKRVAYVACTIILPKDSELQFLMIATLQRDLNSQDPKDICAALTAICKLVTSDLIHALNT